jgi:hypothetical protein
MVASAGLSRVDAIAIHLELPFEIVGGLPIAVVDRACSAPDCGSAAAERHIR